MVLILVKRQLILTNKILYFINGYFVISELEDVLESGYYESPLCYDNVDWFVKEVIKLENKMAFCFKNTKKDFVMKEDDEDF